MFGTVAPFVGTHFLVFWLWIPWVQLFGDVGTRGATASAFVRVKWAHAAPILSRIFTAWFLVPRGLCSPAPSLSW